MRAGWAGSMMAAACLRQLHFLGEEIALVDRDVARQALDFPRDQKSGSVPVDAAQGVRGDSGRCHVSPSDAAGKLRSESA